MIDNHEMSTQDFSGYNINYGKDTQKQIDDIIKKSINDDLDQMFPDSVNYSENNNSQLNINNNNNNSQPGIIRLNLTQQNPIQGLSLENFKTTSIINMINGNHIDQNKSHNVTLPLKQIMPPSQLKFNFTKEFDPQFWRHFYPEKEPFFNYDYGDNLQRMTLKNIIPGNTGVIPLYEGQVNQNNEKHGLGKLTIENKMMIGGWRHNQFTGWGREVDGDKNEIYEGKYVNGKLYGKGIYTNGKEYYVGDFRDKKMIGVGEIFTSEYHYSGQVWNKIPNGKGKMNIYNEGTYEGDFENGLMDGDGIFKWNNGDYFIGEMRKGKMNGLGKLVHKNKWIERGYFRDGHLIKKIDGFENEKNEFNQ